MCNREIDKRGMSGHMKTHTSPPKTPDVKEIRGTGDNGVISYPSNEEKSEDSNDSEHTTITQTQISNEKSGMAQISKKKRVTNNSSSNSAGNATGSVKGNASAERAGHQPKDDVRETEMKEEYQGLFR